MLRGCKIANAPDLAGSTARSNQANTDEVSEWLRISNHVQLMGASGMLTTSRKVAGGFANITTTAGSDTGTLSRAEGTVHHRENRCAGSLKLLRHTLAMIASSGPTGDGRTATARLNTEGKSDTPLVSSAKLSTANRLLLTIRPHIRVAEAMKAAFTPVTFHGKPAPIIRRTGLFTAPQIEVSGTIKATLRKSRFWKSARWLTPGFLIPRLPEHLIFQERVLVATPTGKLGLGSNACGRGMAWVLCRAMKTVVIVALSALVLAGCSTTTPVEQPQPTSEMTTCEAVASLLSNPWATAGQQAGALEVGRNHGCFGRQG